MAFFSPEARAAFGAMRADRELMLAPFLGLALLSLLVPFMLGAWMGAIRLLTGVDSGFLWALLLVLPMAWVLLSVMAFLEAFVMVTVHARSTGNQPTLVSSLSVLFRRSPRLLLWISFEALGLAILVALARYIGRTSAVAGASVASLATTFVIPLIIFDNASIMQAMRASGRIFKPDTSLRIVNLGTWPGLLSIFILFLGTPIMLILVLELAPYVPFVPDWIQNLVIAAPLAAFIVLSMYAMVIHFIFKWAVFEHLVHDRKNPWFPSELIRNPFQ